MDKLAVRSVLRRAAINLTGPSNTGVGLSVLVRIGGIGLKKLGVQDASQNCS